MTNPNRRAAFLFTAAFLGRPLLATAVGAFGAGAAAQQLRSSDSAGLPFAQGVESAEEAFGKQHITELLVNAPPGGIDLLTGYLSKRGDYLALIDRGLGREEAAFARTVALPFTEILRHNIDQAAAVDLSPDLSRPAPADLLEWNGLTMVLPPNSVCSYGQRGLCLDPGLPAPGQGDALTLLPISSRVPPEMEQLYSALGLWAAAHSNELPLAQKLTWTIMGAGTPSAFATNVTPQTLRELDAVMPGGAAAFSSYNQTQALKRALMGRLLKGTGLDKIVTADQLLGAANSRAGIDTAMSEQLMGRLAALGNDMSDGKGYGYSTVGGNVASRARGSATLTAGVDLMNSSDEPISFTPMAHFTQPTSRKQGISSTTLMADMPRRTATVGIRGAAGTFNFDKATTFNKELLDNLTWLMNLDVVKRNWPHLGTRTGAGAAAVSRLSNGRLGPTGRAISSQVAANPLAGNILALAERATGTSWLAR